MKFLIYLSLFIFLLLLAVRVIECNNFLYIDNNINYIKGARSRRRARAFFLILTAYTIIILDHQGIVIKFQRSKYAASTGSLRLQVE